jgi:hypothetical protein
MPKKQKRAEERKIEETKKEEELWKKEQQLLFQVNDNSKTSKNPA